jgi:hypothetical protein
MMGAQRPWVGLLCEPQNMDGGDAEQGQHLTPGGRSPATHTPPQGESPMKRFLPRIPGVVVLAFALCSLGANTSKSGCKSNQTTQTKQDSTKPLCFVDPPVNCVAFCIDVDSIAFSPQCENIEASVRTVLFRNKVLSDAEDLYEQGVQVCPEADPKHWVTPCDVGITQVEHPNQDHEVCQPVAAGCPTFQ